MFPHTWRQHWSLEEDPFVQEDADRDPILARVPRTAVHSSFDRLFGSPGTPSPGVVFGEKGSGKSSLRIAMGRRLAGGTAFAVEYVDFDGFLTEARKADRLPPDGARTARRVVERFGAADHVDAILSLAVTRLAGGILAGEYGADLRPLSSKSRVTLMALAALYHRSDERGRDEVERGLAKRLGLRSARPALRSAGRVAFTLAAVAVAAVPEAGVVGVELPFDPGAAAPWRWAGAAILAATWAFHLAVAWLEQRTARRATRAVRVVPRDPDPLAQLLGRVGASTRRDLALPDGASLGSRLLLLKRFIRILADLGHDSLHVLMDRIDEASMLQGRPELMQPFVASLLEHRLLQFEGLALKLFLPIELARLYLGASPEELKSMRLDKANSIPELRWGGQELAEIAAERLRAVRAPDAPPDAPGGRLQDFLDPAIDEGQLREALGALGTPRLAIGFLGSLLSEHARELEDDLPEGDPGWRVPRRRFDVVHAAWVDRARGLRRALN